LANNQPFVTVVIPAYNAEATIRETINSVLNQTLNNFELFVIDDGSTDATRAIVAEFADPRVHGFSFDHAGPSSARNRGIERASGEFVAFLDADDLWLPDKLLDQTKILLQQPKTALVYSWTDCIDEGGRFLRHGSHVRAEGKVYEQLLSRNFIDNGSAPMVRRCAFEEVGPFDENYRAGEDWDMWLRLAHRYPFSFVPSVQVLYRVHGNSLVSKVEQQLECVIAVLHKGLERLPATPEREQIKNTVTSNIYKYLSVRLVETGNSRQHGLQAGRYWWSFMTTTPTPIRQSGKALMIAGAIFAMVVLPPSLFARLREYAVNLNHRRAHTIVPGAR